jgi:hypothetical protein
MSLFLPSGMSRRHFLRHLAASAATVPAMQFISHVTANAQEVRKRQKACILMWMGGGPPTIDLWDLKPGTKTGGEFKPISTAGDVQISEHLPMTAKVMDRLSIVRSMSTREADHGRGRYYMHTAYVPNPTVIHPTFGSVVSYELGTPRTELQIPSFISIGGDAGSPGYLGMANAPFVVDANGQIRNAKPPGLPDDRMNNRLAMLDVIEGNFIDSGRGTAPKSHQEVYKKAVNLMTSPQMEAFRIDQEDEKTRERYGNDNFGRGLLMARRLVEQGVPFIEVDMGGWDLHANVFETLRDQRLPTMDRAMSALVEDLTARGMYDDVVLVWMGEFGRTPRINQDVGRDHWAASWSVVMGGGGLKGGIAVGETDAEGTKVVGKSYQPGDVWATAAYSLGIPLDTIHTSSRGRPMKVANGGQPISELIG